MVKRRRSAGATATILSRSAAIVVATLAVAPTAHAEPSVPAPPSSGFERRHRVGGQVGGTGLLQAVYRYRAAGPLHLEVGGLAADHGANVSAGLLVGFPVANRWFPYAAFGGGLMGGFGPKPADGCDPKTTDCPIVTDRDTLAFLHLRAGIGVGLGARRRHLVSADAGGWWGTHAATRTDAAGVETHSSKGVLMPMAGLSYFFAF